MENIEKVKSLLSKPQRIVIIPHQNPDADALGSCLGFAYYLKKKGHLVEVISPTTYPAFLEWMNEDKIVKEYSQHNHREIIELIQRADILCCLDFSSYNRLKDLEQVFKDSKAVKIVIDHHFNSDIEADYKFIHVEAAATCELIYQFIVNMGDHPLLDTQIGSYLYAGLVTDTASFKFPSTTKEVHLIAAGLIELGVDTSKIQRLIYDNYSENRLRFLGFALSERLVVLPELHTAYFTFSESDLKRFGHQTGDTEGVVNFALSIKEVYLAVVLIERADGIKLSFRSVGDFAVNDFANQYFAGGGHRNAAGGISHESLSKTLEKFLDLLPNYKEQLEKIEK